MTGTKGPRRIGEEGKVEVNQMVRVSCQRSGTRNGELKKKLK